jgi:heme a synthase
MLDASPRSRADTHRGVRRLAIATVAATLVLIAMGGAVRATDSGLACPDWPACYGQWIPPADLNMWLEHSHRLWAGVVGLLIFWLTVLAFVRHREQPVLWRIGALASLLVLVQAGLGAAVVLLHLRAGLVTSHLAMSWIIVGCLITIAAISRRPTGRSVTHPVEQQVGRWSAAVAVAVLLQGALGSQATGRGAAYVFNAVPIWLADQAWTGHMREILHVTHRFAGYLVAGMVVALAVAARRRWRANPGTPRWVVVVPMIALGLVVVQVGLGISNVLTRAAVWSAIGHLTVASWLWAAVAVSAALGLTRPVTDRSDLADRGPSDGDRPRDQEQIDEEAPL